MSTADRKKPMNTGELFTRIVERLKERHKLPDILDYCLPENVRECVPVRSCSFDILFHLNYGGSEGIYLDVYAQGAVTEDGEDKKYSLGTCKTLHEDDSAMHTMAVLGADFVCEGRRYIREHCDDFCFTGFNVTLFKCDNESGGLKQKGGTLTFYTKKAADDYLKRIFADEACVIEKAVVRDNADRTEEEIWKEEKSVDNYNVLEEIDRLLEMGYSEEHAEEVAALSNYNVPLEDLL